LSDFKHLLGKIALPASFYPAIITTRILAEVGIIKYFGIKEERERER